MKEGYFFETYEHGLPSFSSYTYLKKYKNLPDLGWLLVLLQDPESIFTSVKTLERIIIFTIITTGIFLIAISLLVAKTRIYRHPCWRHCP